MPNGFTMHAWAVYDRALGALAPVPFSRCKRAKAMPLVFEYLLRDDSNRWPSHKLYIKD